MNDRSLLAERAPLVFAGSPLDRAELLRRDPAKLDALRARDDAVAICLCRGEPALWPSGELVWQPVGDLPDDALIVFLGLFDGQPCYAASLGESTPPPSGSEYVEPRKAATLMPHAQAAMFAQGRSLHEWHRRHGFCANCGTATDIAAGGAKRICGTCHAEHFPRVDPVAIMLAEDEDRCLLGRQASWPPGIWSALAGFVEPAETIEEACARELEEEAGVKADIARIRYVMTQPWPFPSSLMIGLVAPVTSSEITVDQQELEQARWFTRDEVRSMLDGSHPDAALPPSQAVARRLAELWADEQV